jgi:hypothetical protein
VVLQKESPARKLELPAAYRLRIYKGGRRGSARKVTGWYSAQYSSDPPEIMAERFVIPSGQVGSF